MIKYIFTFFILFALSELTYAFEIPTDSSKKEMIFDMPEQMPQYPGGADAMDSFIRGNMRYPQKAKKNNIQGKVYIQFIVEKDGSITSVEVRKGANDLLNQEAIRVIRLMPEWNPGSMRGKKVRVRYTLPITFSLS